MNIKGLWRKESYVIVGRSAKRHWSDGNLRAIQLRVDKKPQWLVSAHYLVKPSFSIPLLRIKAKLAVKITDIIKSRYDLK